MEEQEIKEILYEEGFIEGKKDYVLRKIIKGKELFAHIGTVGNEWAVYIAYKGKEGENYYTKDSLKKFLSNI